MMRDCHSLRGLCGLKSHIRDTVGASGTSQPARAVWIEIFCSCSKRALERSQPARAVWIEICNYNHKGRMYRVTACEGCVD